MYHMRLQIDSKVIWQYIAYRLMGFGKNNNVIRLNRSICTYMYLF